MFIYEFFLILMTSILVIFALLFLFSYIILKFAFSKRMDYIESVKYYREEDFDSLKSNEFNFESTDKVLLHGKCFRSKIGTRKALIVISHGSGPGYYAYGNEINYFTERGYDVIAYDNYGCGTSEGQGTNGLPQSILDLYYCLKYIESNKEYKKTKILLYGHSLGAYSVCNVTRLFKKQICGVIALAPFNNSTDLIAQRMKMLGRFLKPFLNFWELKKFGPIAKFETSNSLEITTIPTLLLYSSNDSQVTYQENFKNYEAVTNNKIKFLHYPNKDHRPNISDEAVKYDLKRHEQYRLLAKKYRNKIPKEIEENYYRSLNYKLLVEFDDEVMEQINNFCLVCIDE